MPANTYYIGAGFYNGSNSGYITLIIEEPPFTIGDFSYTATSDSTVIVEQYNGSSSELQIPDTVVLNNRKYAVIAIAANAFQYNYFTSISIPNTIESIGSGAFYGSNNLDTIVLSNSIKRISSNLFNNCSSLKSITIPNSIMFIDYSAFANCSSLESVVILDSKQSVLVYSKTAII